MCYHVVELITDILYIPVCFASQCILECRLTFRNKAEEAADEMFYTWNCKKKTFTQSPVTDNKKMANFTFLFHVYHGTIFRVLPVHIHWVYLLITSQIHTELHSLSANILLIVTNEKLIVAPQRISGRERHNTWDGQITNNIIYPQVWITCHVPNGHSMLNSTDSLLVVYSVLSWKWHISTV